MGNAHLHRPAHSHDLARHRRLPAHGAVRLRGRHRARLLGRLRPRIRRGRPERVLIDHGEEHTVRLALDNGFWGGMTLYPTTKCTPERAADILEMVGTDRIMANSAGDWGKSNPLAVPELILEMKRRGHGEALIRKLVYENPLAFFSQCARWQPLNARERPTEVEVAVKAIGRKAARPKRSMPPAKG